METKDEQRIIKNKNINEESNVQTLSCYKKKFILFLLSYNFSSGVHCELFLVRSFISSIFSSIWVWCVSVFFFFIHAYIEFPSIFFCVLLLPRWIINKGIPFDACSHLVLHLNIFLCSCLAWIQHTYVECGSHFMIVGFFLPKKDSVYLFLFCIFFSFFLMGGSVIRKWYSMNVKWCDAF